MSQTLARIAEHPTFSRLVTAAILFAGVLVGVETSPALVARFGAFLRVADAIILGVFLVEIAVKIGAQGSRPWRYFLDPWNVFDFAIVTVALLPFDAHYLAVLRLARLLRVLRLVRALPRLQILVGALLKSIPSMGYVALLLGMLFYVYAVAGVFLFGGNDPRFFGDLPTAMLSLFRVVTGDAWTDLMYIQMLGCDQYGYDGREALCTAPAAKPLLGAVYFTSFVLVGAMVILNLFIGVIMNGMDEARRENEDLDRSTEGEGPITVEEELAQLEAEADALLSKVKDARARLAAREAG